VPVKFHVDNYVGGLGMLSSNHLSPWSPWSSMSTCSNPSPISSLERREGLMEQVEASSTQILTAITEFQ